MATSWRPKHRSFSPRKLNNPLHDDCLLNLSDEIPPGFSRFRQLIEIVSVDDADRLPGRERFRFYRERGYPLENSRHLRRNQNGRRRH
jgi:DNA polymerase IIIc chi subunit